MFKLTVKRADNSDEYSVTASGIRPLLDHMKASSERWGLYVGHIENGPLGWPRQGTVKDKQYNVVGHWEWEHVAGDHASTWALDNIAEAMNGSEWDADLWEDIANIIRATGRVIGDIESLGTPPPSRVGCARMNKAANNFSGHIQDTYHNREDI